MTSFRKSIKKMNQLLCIADDIQSKTWKATQENVKIISEEKRGTKRSW